MEKHPDGEAHASRELRPAPSQTEILSVVDTIDMLILMAPTPPYDPETLPKTHEELEEIMRRTGKMFGGLYPQEVPQIPLMPVDNLTEFYVKRYPAESMVYGGTTIAVAARRWPHPDLSPKAEKFEALHITEGEHGLHVERQFRVTQDTRALVKVRQAAAELATAKALGLLFVSASDVLELKHQLSATHVIP